MTMTAESDSTTMVELLARIFEVAPSEVLPVDNREELHDAVAASRNMHPSIEKPVRLYLITRAYELRASDLIPTHWRIG